MKKIVLFLVSVLMCVSFTSCDVGKIADYMKEQSSADTEKPQSVQVEWVGEKIDFKSPHDALEYKDYYRYNELSPNVKALYEDLYEAVCAGVNILDVSEHLIKSDEIEGIYRNFVADNPAFFYVSRTCKYLYSNEDGVVTDIMLMYSDGEVTDEYDSNCKLIKVADRKVIANKINELEMCVNNILASIPENLSDVEKEMMINDHLVDAVEYNESDINRFDDSDTVPHLFDAYGALCENDSVCEGYAKAFQLLCYEAGINCIQVEGIGNDSEHMWNAVYLDDWYYVDVTWNDDLDDDLTYHAYFNIPEDVLVKDHTIDSAYLSVPDCDGEKYTYYNYFTAKVESLKKEPANYQKVADDIAEGKSEYVVIYSNGNRLSQDYLRENFLDSDSPFQSYVRKKNYNISLEWEYHVMGDYYYIPVEWDVP